MTSRSPKVTLRATSVAPGLQWGGLTALIDDDFDRLVRHVFERMFRGMPLGPEDAFGLGRPMDRTDSSSMFELNHPEIHTETVELDDRTMIVVDGIPDNANPVVRVKGLSVRVEGLGVQNDLTFELSSVARAENSSASFKNGVLEMVFKRSTQRGTGSKEDEFTLLGR